MKAINLQLEEFGPWMKMTTPPVSPHRKILPISANHKRATTSFFNSKREEEECAGFYQEPVIQKKMQETTMTQLPAIDLINKFILKKKLKRVELKDFNVDDLDSSNEIEYQSQHINHQYFPYRSSVNQYMIKSIKPGLPKNVCTYKIKQSKPHSCTPSLQKQYVFWNQRKLISSNCRQKGFRSTQTYFGK